MKRLTADIEFLTSIDKQLGQIYKDKKYHYLTYREIADFHNLKASDVRIEFSRAKRLIKQRETAWCDGLSSRAINAITMRYNSFEELCEEIDLESIDGVGRKVALEIRRWLRLHA